MKLSENAALFILDKFFVIFTESEIVYIPCHLLRRPDKRQTKLILNELHTRLFVKINSVETAQHFKLFLLTLHWFLHKWDVPVVVISTSSHSEWLVYTSRNAFLSKIYKIKFKEQTRMENTLKLIYLKHKLTSCGNLETTKRVLWRHHEDENKFPLIKFRIN